jgi:four helix bundle protein
MDQVKKVDIKQRTYDFALRIIEFVNIMPKNTASIILVRQLLRAGTSIGANVEEASCAFTKKDFIY